MKRVKFLALAATLMFAAACSEPLDEAAEELSPQKESIAVPEKQVCFTPEEMGYLTELANGTPKISVDSAAKVALSVMGNSSSLSKRSLSVTAFGTPKVGSLSKSFTDSDIDTTIFVFNAPGSNGFAVVAADARIPQQVLAFSETGHFVLDSDNPAFSVFLDCAQNYAAECIAKAQENRDSIENSILVKLGIKTEDAHKGLSKKEVLYKILLTNMCTKHTSIEVVSEVKPMITTNWYQSSPYNDNVKGGDTCNHCQAGCVAIATSQLVTYWRFPNIINSFRYDWNLISNDANFDDPTYKNQVASLVAFVGSSVGTNYGCDRSGADTPDAIRFLRRLGYSAPNLQSYGYDKIVNSLNNGCPVLMRGKREKKKKFLHTEHKGGHAWLVDGHVHQMIRTVSGLTYVVVERDDNGVVSSHYESGDTEYSLVDNKFLHINWGWGARSNGYYSKDVFHVGERRLCDDNGRYVVVAPQYNTDNVYQYQLEIAVNIHK